MKSIIFNAPWSLSFAGKSGMFLFSTVFTLGNTRTRVSTTYYNNITSNIEATINKHFCRSTTLEILNINPDYNYV